MPAGLRALLIAATRFNSLLVGRLFTSINSSASRQSFRIFLRIGHNLFTTVGYRGINCSYQYRRRPHEIGLKQAQFFISLSFLTQEWGYN